jgi:D-alanyl-D-alanine carboxypeptidase (penicillin-binding protein 5/6)
MNREARRLGLEKTRFAEPSGISEYNVTTALEFARFCRIYLREHPETLEEFHSVTEFAYPKAENVAEPYREKPGTIPQANHNRLLGKVEGVDGLKTGYIDEAGYNIALTAERRGFRLIAVILGAPAGYGGDRIRDEDGRKLLTWGFGHFTTLRPDFGPLPPLRVWKGKTNFAAVVPGETPEFTAPIDRGQGLRWEIEAEDPVTAPFPAGTILGDLVLYDRFGELRRLPLVSANPVPEGNILQRLRDSLILLFRSPGKGKRPVAAGSSRP